ncbi:MAG: LON peptidase substrate-binding domain-containing protein [Vicinamibacterales bacterium]
MSPDLLPLFPLPNVVLFPGVFLPLHVFEPRYREMVRDALADDRLIGMTLLRPGWEPDYEGRPAVYPVGCSGVITHCEELDDGRFNIILRGLERFRIEAEDDERSYRRALVHRLQELTPSSDERLLLRADRARLEALLSPCQRTGGFDPRAAAAMNDDDFVNALAQYLDLVPIEKQALLELPGLAGRAHALADLLEMKTMTTWAGTAKRAH